MIMYDGYKMSSLALMSSWRAEMIEGVRFSPICLA